MAHQQKLRGGSASQVAAMTPAQKEVVIDTTNNRFHVGDGVRAGGFPSPNAFDIQRGSFNYASAGGTANAITLTYSPAPTAYAVGQLFRFKASATCGAGGVDVNVNTIGNQNLLKMAAGTLVELDPGDIVINGIYEIAHDGTQFQLMGVAPPVVSQNGLVPIDAKTVSGAAAIDFTTGIDSSFNSYLFELENCYSSNVTVGLQMLVGVGSFITSNYWTAGAYITSGVQTLINTSAQGSALFCPSISLSGHHSGQVNLTAVAGTNPSFNCNLQKRNNSASGAGADIRVSGGCNGTTSQIDRVRFQSNTPGSFTITGAIRMYGVTPTI